MKADKLSETYKVTTTNSLNLHIPLSRFEGKRLHYNSERNPKR